MKLHDVSRRLRTMPLLLLLAALSAAPAAAQRGLAGARDSARLEGVVLEAARAHAVVRAVLEGGDTLEGRLDYHGRGVFSVGGRRRSVSQLRALDQRTLIGGSAEKGFELGAAAGTSLVGAIVVGMCEGECADDPRALLGILAGGAVLGGVPGGLVGGALDPPALGYVRLWPRGNPLAGGGGGR